MNSLRRKCRRFTVSSILLLVFPVIFVAMVLFNFNQLTREHCNCPLLERNRYDTVKLKKKVDGVKHRLAVLVPFRDRFEELLHFAPYMYSFLNKQQIDHDIFILNQIDQYRFNRASLINTGFLKVKNDYDYIAMHDIDLLPLNSDLSYAYPAHPMHLAAPHLHPRYNYEKFIGGILLINREQFELVDGLSNRYWGWGLEDDEFYVRLKDAHLNITRPANIMTTTKNTFRHIHGKNRRRDTVKCYNQREVTRRRDRKTGLHDVKYNVLSYNSLEIDGAPVVIINIQLVCDKSTTPWCDCAQKQTEQKTEVKGNI